MITPEQFVAILGGLATLIGALGALIYQVRRTHQLVNSRMTELLELTRSSSRAQGVLDATTVASALQPAILRETREGPSPGV